MKDNQSNSSKIKLQDEELVGVDQFTTKTVNIDMVTNHYNEGQDMKGLSCIQGLRHICTSAAISVRTKLHIFSKMLGLYCSVPMRPGAPPAHILHTFVNKCLCSYCTSSGKTGSPMKRYGEEQDRTHLTIRSKGERGVGLAPTHWKPFQHCPSCSLMESMREANEGKRLK